MKVLIAIHAILIDLYLILLFCGKLELYDFDPDLCKRLDVWPFPSEWFNGWWNQRTRFLLFGIILSILPIALEIARFSSYAQMVLVPLTMAYVLLFGLHIEKVLSGLTSVEDACVYYLSVLASGKTFSGSATAEDVGGIKNIYHVAKKYRKQMTSYIFPLLLLALSLIAQLVVWR